MSYALYSDNDGKYRSTMPSNFDKRISDLDRKIIVLDGKISKLDSNINFLCTRLESLCEKLDSLENLMGDSSGVLHDIVYSPEYGLAMLQAKKEFEERAKSLKSSDELPKKEDDIKSLDED